MNGQQSASQIRDKLGEAIEVCHIYYNSISEYTAIHAHNIDGVVISIMGYIVLYSTPPYMYIPQLRGSKYI